MTTKDEGGWRTISVFGSMDDLIEVAENLEIEAHRVIFEPITAYCTDDLKSAATLKMACCNHTAFSVDNIYVFLSRYDAYDPKIEAAIVEHSCVGFGTAEITVVSICGKSQFEKFEEAMRSLP